MINAISILNLISIVFLLASLGIILFVRIDIELNYRVLLGTGVGILLFVTITNLLEHAGITDALDKYEDVIEILFFPVFIFAVFSHIITTDLSKRVLENKMVNAVFNQTFTFIGLLDKKGRMLESNNTALKFINKELKDVANVFFWDTPWWEHSEDERQKLIDAFENIKIKKTRINFETTHRSVDGEIYYIDFSMTPILNQENEIEFFIPEGRDISPIKKAEDKLKKYSDELEGIVTERTEELQATLEEHKATNDELFVKNAQLEEINNEINNKKKIIEDLLEEKEQKNEELNEINQNLRNTLESLEAMQEQLIQSEKMASLGILTAGIAHEINNPVNFISSGMTGLEKCLNGINNLFTEYIEILKAEENLNPIFEKLREKHNLDKNLKGIQVLFENMKIGVNRTTDIINSLHTYIRTDSEEMVMANINNIIEDVLKMLYHEYKNRIEINKNYCNNATVKCLPGKINQLFMNLIGNAIQAIENNGGIDISTELLDEQNELRVKISDTGIGMSKETQKKIFDPFFTTKPIGKGSGLGLSIAFNILKEHNATVNVKSELNKGSTFSIVFPVDEK